MRALTGKVKEEDEHRLDDCGGVRLHVVKRQQRAREHDCERRDSRDRIQSRKMQSKRLPAICALGAIICICMRVGITWHALATASFRTDSPKTIAKTSSGTPHALKTESTETGSVAEMSEPKTRDASRPIG